MESTNLKLILASQSPRRRELLGWLDVPFSISPSTVDEHSDEKDPQSFCEDIARQKGLDVWNKVEDKSSSVLVSADTMVFLGQDKLGKPRTVDEARAMLEQLAGRTHQVMTSVFMKKHDQEHMFTVKSDVTFDHIDHETMEHYLASGESLDKAGAYGIQGKGLIFVREVKGSYSNVVGFPLCEFKNEFVRFLGFDQVQDWRKRFE